MKEFTSFLKKALLQGNILCGIGGQNQLTLLQGRLKPFQFLLMTSVQTVCQTQDCRQLCHGQIGFPVQTANIISATVINEFTVVKPDHICNNLPLLVGQTDHLCSHDNLVRALANIHHADEFTAFLQNRSQPEIQQLSASQSMDFLQAVENGNRNIFQRLCALSAAHIALVHVHGTGYDIAFEIMLSPKQLLLLRILISNTVAKGHTGHPDLFHIHKLG